MPNSGAVGWAITSPAALAAIIGMLTVATGLADAQTGPAPATNPSTTASPAIDDRPDFSGTWSLDRSLSTDPNQVSFAPGSGGNRSSNGPARGGLGFGGFGRQRGGDHAGSRDSTQALTPSELAGLKVLTDEIKSESAMLVITHQEPSFVVSDAHADALFFQTTGAPDQNQLGTETLTSSTHWDGSRLVTEYTLGTHLTLVYTYTLLQKTNQLVVRVTRKADSSQRLTSPEIRLVYKLSSRQPQ